MADDLAPFFESRETRMGRLPDDIRSRFQAILDADPDNKELADRQFASVWLSRRIGAPREQVVQNFDAIASKLFGPGTTGSTAYDKIVSLYHPPEDTGGPVEPENAEGYGEVWVNATGAARMPRNGFLANTRDAASVAGSSFQQVGMQAAGGMFSQLAALSGAPHAPFPMDDPEYARMQLENERIMKPHEFSEVYDEGMRAGPVLSEEESATFLANQNKQRLIVRRLDAEHRTAVNAWFLSDSGAYSREARSLAKFWYDLAEEGDKRWEIDPAFRETTVGKVSSMVGSTPAYAALAATGPASSVLVESAIFGQEEQQRMQTEGPAYDPQAAAPEIAVSAVGQAVLEKAFGVERLLGETLRETTKVAGRVRFGEVARNFIRRAAISGTEEGITEPVQGFWSDYIASLTYDENRELLTGDGAKRRLIESLGGFVMGAAFGGGISAVSDVDQNMQAARIGSRMLTAHDGQPFTPEEFTALRPFKTDDELKAYAGDEASGELLLRAVNGDQQAMVDYNTRVRDAEFVDTEDAVADGIQIGDVMGVATMRNADGTLTALDLADPDVQTFLQQWQAKAALTKQAEIEAEANAAANQEILAKLPPEKLEDIKGAIANPNAYLQYTVWPSEMVPPGMDRVMQVDFIDPTAEKGKRNVVSTNRKVLAALGRETPEAPPSLPTGTYTETQIRDAAIAAGIMAEVPVAHFNEPAEPLPPERTEIELRAERIQQKQRTARGDLARRIEKGLTIPAKVRRSAAVNRVSIAAYLAQPIASRLAHFNPRLGARLRKMELTIHQRIAADLRTVGAYIDGAKRVNDADGAMLDLALRNGDRETINAINAKYGLTAQYDAAVAMFESVRARMIETGLNVGKIENYWPRLVTDLDGLIQHYYGTPEQGVIDLALKQATEKAGHPLDPDEREAVVNSALRGYRPQMDKRPGFTKERPTDVVSVDASRFYAPFSDAALSYVSRMNEAIEQRRFFGQHAPSSEATIDGITAKSELDKSIGALVDEMVADGSLSPEGQMNVRKALEARFTYQATTGIIATLRNLGHLSTLSQFTSTITQLGDWQFALFEGGFLNTLAGTIEAVTGKSKVKLKDLGIDRVAEEFRNKGGRLSRAVDVMFKAIGFDYVVRTGQQSLVNSALRRMQKEAQLGKLGERTKARMDTLFTDSADWSQTMLDLQAGAKTENTVLLAWTVLSDWNPTSLSEYPEGYLRHPNGRIFYALKSFDMKRLDAYRREGFAMIANGNAAQKRAGFRNLMLLSGLFMAAGVGVDWLKDWLIGRRTDLQDETWRNVWKLFGLNKYSFTRDFGKDDPLAEKIAKVAASAPGNLAEWLLPPLSWFTTPAKDIARISDKISKGEDIGWDDLESVRLLPVVGTTIYNRYGRGSKTQTRAPSSGRRRSRLQRSMSR